MDVPIPVTGTNFKNCYILSLAILFVVLMSANSVSTIASAKPSPDAKMFASYVRKGMQDFRENDVEGSLNAFDAALLYDAMKRPYLWQRGLSLYYLDQFAEGSKQFRDDVAVNPNDTEESIWAFMCEAKIEGFERARTNLLVVGRDSRPVMRAAYELFRGDGSLGHLRLASKSSIGSRRDHDEFYSMLYQGLFHEAAGRVADARQAIHAALQTPYAASDDYMVALARVHMKRRNWDANPETALVRSEGSKGGGGNEIKKGSEKQCDSS